MVLARFGIPAAYITRVPDNPYGWLVRDTARGQGINTDYFVWAPKAEPVGRLLYELGRTPRKSVGYYQRMYSAASRLGAGHGGLEDSPARLPPVSHFRHHLWPFHAQQVRAQFPAGSLSRGGRKQAGRLPGGDGLQLPCHACGRRSSAGRR